MEPLPEPTMGGAEAEAFRSTSSPALPQPGPDLGRWEQETGREPGGGCNHGKEQPLDVGDP